MAQIHYTVQADEDYVDIWEYIAADNPNATTRLLQEIDGKLMDYAAEPGMGTPRDDLIRGLRSFPVGDYLVFYRPVSDGIEVIRVVHGARNLRRLFRR